MADETANPAKRSLEEDVEDTAAAEDAPAEKKQKTEGDEAAPAADGEEQQAAAAAAAAAAGEEAKGAAEEDDAAEGDADADMGEDAGAEEGDEAAAADGDAAANGGEAAATAAAAGGPVKLGYRTFNNSREAADYLQEVLKKATPHRKLNEYESVMLLDLLRMGHPSAEQKLAGGLRAFVVAERRVDGNTTTCFHIKRLDNSLEDFSYRKCLSTLFPEYVLTNPSHDHKGRGGGGGRGGRGGGRGGGGRGGGRGGGGRGGRGSGGRGRGGRGRGGRGRQ